MKRVLTAVILIPIVVLALFKAPLWLFTLLVFGVATLAAHEYLAIAKATGFRPFKALSYFFLASTFLIIWSSTPRRQPAGWWLETWVNPLSWLLVVSSPFILMIAAMHREPLSQVLPDASISLLLLPYIGLTLGCLPIVRSYDYGEMYLLIAMLIVWAGDIAAYYVGRAIGKHKLAPRVSPGKTWEGTAASTAGAVVLAFWLFRCINPLAHFLVQLHLLIPRAYTSLRPIVNYSPRFPVAPGSFVVAFAICVNVAAQLGDLVESAIKRGAGVKDSGTLFPGHGGMLDRIDALLFALPVAWVFYVSGFGDYFAAH